MSMTELQPATKTAPTRRQLRRQQKTVEKLALGVAETATALSLSESTIRSLIAAGEIKAFRSSDGERARLLVPTAEITRWLSWRLERETRPAT